MGNTWNDLHMDIATPTLGVLLNRKTRSDEVQRPKPLRRRNDALKYRKESKQSKWSFPNNRMICKKGIIQISRKHEGLLKFLRRILDQSSFTSKDDQARIPCTIVLKASFKEENKKETQRE